jgi:hypothetical protein
MFKAPVCIRILGKNQQNIHGNLKINWGKVIFRIYPWQIKGINPLLSGMYQQFLWPESDIRGGCRSPLASYRASLSLRRYCRETGIFSGYPFIVIQ